MSVSSPTAALTAGVALLERSLSYALGGLLLVTDEAMASPTPCEEWDLRQLLLHMNDSLAALHEAVALGHVDLDPRLPGPGDPAADYGDPQMDPVGALRNRACRLMGAWVSREPPVEVVIADRSLAASIVAAAGALEVAVHGWDVARASGSDRPIPEELAEELLALAELFVTPGDRPGRFAPAVGLSAPPGGPAARTAADRLLAFLGRTPHGG